MNLLSTWLREVIPINLGAFSLFSWQLLFVLGVLFSLSSTTNGGELWRKSKSVSLGIFIMATVLFLLRHDLLPQPRVFLEVGWLLDKQTLGPVRLLNTLVLAHLLSGKVLWPPGALHVRFLAYLGRHSLFVFSYHILLVYTLQFGIYARGELSASNEIVVVLLAVLSLFAAAWLPEKVKTLARSSGRIPATKPGT